MAVEWTITIEGRNEFYAGRRFVSTIAGNVCLTALLNAVVNHEAETLSPGIAAVVGFEEPTHELPGLLSRALLSVAP